MKKKEIESVILMNKMCTGSFTINNIGHEIINYFKDDNGDNYIYISPYGGMDSKYDNKIDKIILTSSLSNKRVEILAVIEIEKNGQIHKGGDRGNKEIHKKQIEILKNVTYGGVNLEEIFKNNKKNDEAIYVTFKAKSIRKPKNNIKIYISNNETDKENQYNIIKVEKNLPSSSLKGYFIKDEKVENKNGIKQFKDFYKIKKFLEENEELFEPYNSSSISKEDVHNFELKRNDINYLQLIEKEDEEQIYTNLFYYWFNRNNLFELFVNKKLNINDTFNLSKEKRIKHGRMDIFAISKEKAIIIENKIQSGLNGINKEEEQTQLGKYVKEIKDTYNIDQKNIFGLIFVPDYNVEIIKKEIKELEKTKMENGFSIITYGDIFEFFNSNNTRELIKDDMYKEYYEDFLRCIRNHTFKNIAEKNKYEMERKFIYAIKKSKEKK